MQKSDRGAGRQSSKVAVVASCGLWKKRLEGCHQGSRGIGQELKGESQPLELPRRDPH